LNKSKSKFYNTINKVKNISPSSLSFNSGNLINVSVVLSAWLLSIVMLFSFHMKMDSNVNYNSKVKENNSMKLKISATNLNRISEKLKKATVDDKMEIQHEYYDALVELLAGQSKCNSLKLNPDAVPFPTTEVMISFIMIGLCVSVIISQNLLNNPFEVMNKYNMIKQRNNLKTQMGGGGMMNNEERLLALQQFNASLTSGKYQFLTNITVAFTVLLSVIYLSYKLLNNTLRYKSELFNGKLFGESVCYSM